VHCIAEVCSMETCRLSKFGGRVYREEDAVDDVY